MPSASLKPRDIPNLITGLRILLVVPVLGLLLQEHYALGLLLFFVAGLSDGVDGYLAKRFGWTSRLGSLLDPIADKLLLMGTVLALGWQGHLPAWLVLLVVLRDVVILGGALVYHYWVEPLQARPSRISKLNTLNQLALVLAIICDLGIRPLPDALLTILLYATALTTLWSGVGYSWQWGAQALKRRGRQHNGT